VCHSETRLGDDDDDPTHRGDCDPLSYVNVLVDAARGTLQTTMGSY
jgi:hypothetical protein